MKGHLAALASRVSRTLPELTWVAAGQVAAFSGGVFGVVVLTARLSVAAYGELALGMTIAGFLHILVFGQLNNAFVRLFPTYRERRKLYVHSYGFRRVHFATVGVLGAISTLVVLLLWSTVGRHWAALVALSVVYALLTGTSTYYMSFSSAVRYRPAVAVYQGLDPWLRPVGALAGIRVSSTGVGAMVGYCGAAAIACYLQQLFALRRRREFEDAGASSTPDPDHSEFLVDVRRYVGPLIAAAVVTSASMYGDRWAVQAVLGVQSVAVYTVLLQIATAPPSLVGGAMSTLLVPVLFNRAGALSTAAQLQSTMRLLWWGAVAEVLLLLPLLIATACWSHQVVALLAPVQYSAAHGYLPWMVVALTAYAVGQHVAVGAYILQRTSLLLAPWTLNAVLTVGLSAALGHYFGLSGVVVALVVSDVAFATLWFWVIYRATRLALRDLSKASNMGPARQMEHGK
jgi:O-antigen/teichoic acid export membrane protein